jgi:short-subunit dehydrogenase
MCRPWPKGSPAELGPRGVDVLASAPGPVHTGFAERAGMRIRDADSAAGVAEGTLRALGRRSLVRPGPLSRTLGYALAGLPRRGRTLILGRVMAGMISKGVDGANSAQRPA